MNTENKICSKCGETKSVMVFIIFDNMKGE